MTRHLHAASGLLGLGLAVFGVTILLNGSVISGELHPSVPLSAFVAFMLGLILMPRSLAHPLLAPLTGARPAAASSRSGDAARADHAPSRPRRPRLAGSPVRAVALAPQVPPEVPWKAPAMGRLGGQPALPDDLPWPVIDGRPARFLAQVNFSALPRGLWGGMAPDTGWLSLFVSPADPAELRLLMHAEPGMPVTRPADSPGGLDGAPGTPVTISDDSPVAPDPTTALRNRVAAIEGRPAAAPAWPLRIAEARGWEAPKAALPTRDRTEAACGLDTAAWRPFDWTSAFCLLAAVRQVLERRVAAAEAGEGADAGTATEAVPLADIVATVGSVSEPDALAPARADSGPAALATAGADAGSDTRTAARSDAGSATWSAPGAQPVPDALADAGTDAVASTGGEHEAAADPAPAARQSLALFDALEAELTYARPRARFSPQMLALLLEGLGRLDLPEESPEEDSPPLLADYFRLFETYARGLYAADPASLPGAPRRALEPLWSAEAGGLLVLGGPPHPVSAEARLERPVRLMTLRPSPLAEWDFGPGRELVIHIAADDLALLDFTAARGALVERDTAAA